MEPSNYNVPLVEAVLQLMSASDQASLFDLATRTAQQYAQVEQVSLVVFNPSRRDVQAIYGRSIYENTPTFNALWDGLEGWVVREQKPTFSPEPLQDVRVSTPMRLALQNAPSPGAVAAAPCGAHGVLIAVGAGLDKNSAEVLNTIGKTVSLAEAKMDVHTQEAPLPTITSQPEMYWQTIGLIGQGSQQIQLNRAVGNTEAGNGGVWLITGPAGSGKTTLAEWLIRQVQGRNFEVVQTVVKPQAVQYEVWRQVIAQLYPDLPRTLEASRTFLKNVNPRWEGRAGLLLALLQGSHINDPGLAAYTAEQRHEATITLVVDLLLQASQQKPLAVVIEEVDELGEGSRDVLYQLSHRLKFQPSRLLIVATSTADLHADLHTVALHPLSLEQVGQVRQTLVGNQVAPILDEWLLAQTQGNPLFLRLLAGSLAESNQLLTPPPTSGDLPTIIQALINQLPPAQQTTLCAAAVVGSPFSLRELAAVHPQHPGEEAIRAELKQLAIFIKPLIDGRMAFRHKIYGEQVLAACDPAVRQDMHRAMAEYLERHAATQAGQIAYHYQHSRLPHQARPYLIRAANVAHARRAYQDALGYISENLSLPGSLDDMEGFTILSEQADLYGEMGRYQEQSATLNRLTEIAQRINDPWLHAESGWRWLQHYIHTNQAAEGLATWQIFLAQAEKAMHTVARAEIMIATALLHQQLEHFEDAQAQLDAVSQVAGNARNYILGARILFTLGQTFEQNAQYDLAQACYEQALEIYRSSGNQVGLANSYSSLGRMYYELGYFNMSQTHLQNARQLWQSLGNIREAVENTLTLIEMKLQQQRYQDATALANDIRLEVEQLAEPHATARWWLAYGHIYQGFGNREQALESYRKGLAVAPEAEKPLAYAALVQLGDAQHLPNLQSLNLQDARYPATVYTVLANVTRDPQTQQQIVAAGQQQIQSRAAKITDEQIRQQFLSRPDRRTLLEYRTL